MRWHGASSCNSATGKPGHFITQKSTADELRSSRLFSGFEGVELPGSIRQDARKKQGLGILGSPITVHHIWHSRCDPQG